MNKIELGGLWLIVSLSLTSSILGFISGNIIAGCWALNCFFLSITLVNKQKLINLYREAYIEMNNISKRYLDRLSKEQVEHTEKDNLVVGIDFAIPNKKKKK